MKPPTEDDVGKLIVSEKGRVWHISERDGRIGVFHKRWGFRYPVDWRNWRRLRRERLTYTLPGGAGGMP